MSNLRAVRVCLFPLLLATWSSAGVGESAVITLQFPPGARATGLGEAFTGLSDDVNATYFNPAGLGQEPLANTWHVFLKDKGYTFTSIVARHKKAFELREEIWAGTATGVLRYNGRAWQDFEEHMVTEGDDLQSIVERFFGEGHNEAWMKAAIAEIKRANRIDAKRRVKVLELLAAELGDTARAGAATRLTEEIIALPPLERSAARVFALIGGTVDSTRADSLADRIAAALESDDRDLKHLVELKIPFSIAVRESVTALAYDDANQLWVGTQHGLWRYDGVSWKHFTSVDGLPADRITCLTVGEFGTLAVGTDRGLAEFSDGLWKKAGALPDSHVTALRYGPGEALYVGTPQGVAYRPAKDSAWIVYDTTSGLLSEQVTALYVDSDGRLWIGGPDGVTVYTKAAWKRYRFPGSTVLCLAEYGKGRMWIGTDRGVLRYIPQKPRTDRHGNVKERPPEWKVFHSKTGLAGEQVRGIAIHGKDVWLATESAINQYDHAQREAMSFYEPLLPAFGIRDLWHLYMAGVWPTEDWGTIGLMINYIHMGVNEFYDALGREVGAVRSWEGVFGVSYGLALMRDFSLGLNVKYAHSALAPGMIEGDPDAGVGQTFGIDASLLKRNLFLRGLDIGFMFQNMGPAVFYVDPADADPIPFLLRLGLAYRAVESPVHNLNIVLDLYREFVKNRLNGAPDPFYKALFTSLQDQPWKEEVQEIQISLGMEYWYIQFLALRLGFLFDYIGERYELTFGLGLRYGAINFDWSYIHSPEGMLKGFLQSINETKTGATGARHGQWRVSLITRF